MAIPQERFRVSTSEMGAVATAVPRMARVSWAGVWSGFLAGLGALLLFAVLGVAVGLTVVDAGAAESARGFGLGAGIWAGISLLIALFIGGMVASGVGMVLDREAGGLHGGLVWALAMVGLVWLGVSGVSFGASALFGALGGVTRSLGAAAGAAGGTSATGELTSGDIDHILARLDDPQTVEIVVAATGMSAADARGALTEIHGRVEAARSDPARATAEARDGIQNLLAQSKDRAVQAAAQATPRATTASWITFGAMCASLIVAVLGGVTGSAMAAPKPTRIR